MNVPGPVACRTTQNVMPGCSEAGEGHRRDSANGVSSVTLTAGACIVGTGFVTIPSAINLSQFRIVVGVGSPCRLALLLLPVT